MDTRIENVSGYANYYGLQYGGCFDDLDALREKMSREEEFITRSPKRRKLLIDLNKTNITKKMISEFMSHLERMAPKIIKLAATGEWKYLRPVGKTLQKSKVIGKGQMYFDVDIEECKTWLVGKR